MGKTSPLVAACQRCSSSELIQYAMVDAFTNKAYKGNPAGVVLLPTAKDEEWMQQVAAEFNVSQTAFVVRAESDSSQRTSQGDEGVNAGGNGFLQPGREGHSNSNAVEAGNEYHIRWFTPTLEVDLCGHATLASSHVLFSTGIVHGDTIYFHCKSGKLTVRRVESIAAQNNGAEMSPHLLELDFPMTTMTLCAKSEIKALTTTLNGVEVVSVGRTAKDDLIVELSLRQAVENLQPQMHELVQCSGRGVHFTAEGGSQSSMDFVSRCFFPKLGINEDPVCGSAHCALTPYWVAKLQKSSLQAYQASKRGGHLSLRMDFRAGRVFLRGEAVTVMIGVLLR